MFEALESFDRWPEPELRGRNKVVKLRAVPANWTRYEASHILVQPQDASAEADEAARLLALGAALELRRRPELFPALAQTLSACPSCRASGSLGALRPGDLPPELERALLRLAPGQVAERPVRSRSGWHVLRLDRLLEERCPATPARRKVNR
jgi:parvulin-like peptidyl-prolyl isomerase